jgi:hypothetical protein
MGLSVPVSYERRYSPLGVFSDESSGCPTASRDELDRIESADDRYLDVICASQAGDATERP